MNEKLRQELSDLKFSNQTLDKANKEKQSKIDELQESLKKLENDLASSNEQLE